MLGHLNNCKSKSGCHEEQQKKINSFQANLVVLTAVETVRRVQNLALVVDDVSTSSSANVVLPLAPLHKLPQEMIAVIGTHAPIAVVKSEQRMRSADKTSSPSGTPLRPDASVLL